MVPKVKAACASCQGNSFEYVSHGVELVGEPRAGRPAQTLMGWAR